MQSTDEALLSIVRSPRFRRWLRAIVLFLAIIISIRSSIIDINLVPSASMVPTIPTGDHILINKLAYDLKFPLTRLHLLKWGDPKIGDIVVFDSPYGVRLVKRVVAVGGDEVSMTANTLSINGKPCTYQHDGNQITETLPAETLAGETTPARRHLIAANFDGKLARSTFAPIKLKPDRYFLMGDNRDESADSRVIGPVPRWAIVGRVIR